MWMPDCTPAPGSMPSCTACMLSAPPTTICVFTQQPSTTQQARHAPWLLRFGSPGVSGDKLGYIKVATFNSNTTEGVERALADMKKEGVAALLLDIRNNGGGLFPAGGWACSEMNKWCQ